MQAWIGRPGQIEPVLTRMAFGGLIQPPLRNLILRGASRALPRSRREWGVRSPGEDLVLAGSHGGSSSTTGTAGEPVHRVPAGTRSPFATRVSGPSWVDSPMRVS